MEGPVSWGPSDERVVSMFDFFASTAWVMIFLIPWFFSKLIRIWWYGRQEGKASARAQACWDADDMDGYYKEIAMMQHYQWKRSRL